jgi:hypothetical protein
MCGQKKIGQTLFKNGINAIQSKIVQVMSQQNRKGKPKIEYHYTGQKTK